MILRDTVPGAVLMKPCDAISDILAAGGDAGDGGQVPGGDAIVATTAKPAIADIATIATIAAHPQQSDNKRWHTQIPLTAVWLTSGQLHTAVYRHTAQINDKLESYRHWELRSALGPFSGLPGEQTLWDHGGHLQVERSWR